MKKLVLFLLLALALALSVAVFLRGRSDGPEAPPVRVERGTVVRHAVATGHVRPAFEVPVKSRTGGVLTERFVTLGERVAKDQPLFEVRPVVTDVDRLQAERSLLAAREAEENVTEFREGRNLLGRAMLFMQGRKNVERLRKSAERGRHDAERQLALLQEGRVEIEGKVIDYVVRSPVEAHVVDLPVEVGQPVVPASSYGSGTEIVALADLDAPRFHGTVNEIDVGRLKEGMQASIAVGALPGVAVRGELTEIALRSRSVNNATVFTVRLDVTPPEGVVLRAGYSAVARIETERAEDVLVLPERVVDYRGERAFVRLADGTEREVQVGVSDGLTVEVRSGLAAGDEVLERY